MFLMAADGTELVKLFHFTGAEPSLETSPHHPVKFKSQTRTRNFKLHLFPFPLCHILLQVWQQQSEEHFITQEMDEMCPLLAPPVSFNTVTLDL